MKLNKVKTMTILTLAAVFFAASAFAAHPPVPDYAADGGKACAVCHADEAADFQSSVHYGSVSVVDNENFFFPGGGKHGMLDRACALVGSNMLLNMLTTSYVPEPDDSMPDEGSPAQQCGTCHTNYYITLMQGMLMQPPFNMSATEAGDTMMAGADCLVCHAETYDFDLRKQYEADPLGLNMSFGTIAGVPQRIRQDRTDAAIASIVATPSDEACLRCHEHGRSDYKRGELPDPEHDIHYELGVSGDNACIFCHSSEMSHHKFNRGAMVNGDIFASDFPVNGEDNDLGCGTCHTEAPHYSKRLNEHVEKVSCETCHITYTAGAESTVWADGGFLGLAKGPEGKATKLYTKKSGGTYMTEEELWQTYKHRPVYMEFSGLTTFLAQPIPLNPAVLGGQDRAPKIYPFKSVINPMPFDGRFFGVGGIPTDMDSDGVNDWSMFAAMRMFADQYKMLGFMDSDFDFTKFAVNATTGMLETTVLPSDPKYPSYAAMAQMAAFPNLLFFDKYTFGYNWYQNLQDLADAGKITTWDAASRPLEVKDMNKAVEVGMSRLLDMMMMMGFDPTAYGMTAAEMKAMYALTDDQLVVMAAPPGSEMHPMLKQMGYANWANYPAYTNGITLGGHGIRRDEALFCGDCHNPGGVFEQLVEVPKYGPNGMPQLHWEFYSSELLALAEAGTPVDDVWAAGYAKKGDDFEMGLAFETASEAAAKLGITAGYVDDGSTYYIAVLTPTTKMATNWEVLGYSAAKVAELTNQTSSSDAVGTDVEKGEETSACFIEALGFSQ